MSERILTREQSRLVDKIAIERYGFTGLVLMENAGRGVAETLMSLDPGLVDAPAQLVAILCGKGNNAGDGFVIARHLEIRGIRSRILLLAAPTELQGDALANYEILRHTKVPIVDLSAVDNLTEALNQEAAGAAWILDAMLGTGAQGEPREPVATAIRWMNSQPARRLAVDLPSGLDCDSGQPAACTVRADHTCTFVAPKTGFAASTSRDYLGQVHVVSIGIPDQLLNKLDA